MKKTSLSASLSLLAAIALASPVAAAGDGDHYVAVSKTAMSITGDVWMDDFGITFENDEALEFSDLVADHLQVDGKRVPASVYRVKTPGDPELLNGNTLCGADVTYLANWSAGKGMTAIAVFTGNRPPKSSDGMCALYTYEDQQ